MASPHSEEHADRPTAIAVLKERIYVTFTGLAIVLVLYEGAAHLDARVAFATLLVGLLGVTAAAFASDVVANLAVQHKFPDAAEMRVLLRISLGSLSTAIAPLGVIVLAWVGVLGIETALILASYFYLAILGLIGWLAIRDARLRLSQKLVALAALIALALVVIAIQVVAHGH